MTDIRQHLPLILTTVRHALSEADPSATLKTRLRESLPASYGIGSGYIMNAQGESSLPLDVIIYDTTIEKKQPIDAADVYELRQVLAVILLQHELDRPGLQKELARIASVKVLRAVQPLPQVGNERPLKGKKAAQKPDHSLKKFLPLGIVACQRLLFPQADSLEQLALKLDSTLKEGEESTRPDYLIAQEQGCLYTHPGLQGGTFVTSTINIAREPALKKPHPCYVCKQPFTHAHFFYRYLCLRCGDLNYRKRAISVDLTGRIALVTGARVKIGYATALRLLRAGAQVIATTRFPHDAALRYSTEKDFAEWQDRLHIYGLDFRYLPVLDRFVEHLYTTYPCLDIVINNAAQTIRRPLEYYAGLLPLERAGLNELSPSQQALVARSHLALPPTPFAVAEETPASLPAEMIPQYIPSATLLHDYGSQAVLADSATNVLISPEQFLERGHFVEQERQNSWTLPFNKIDLTEFLEVQTINVTAPFLLISHLHPLLCRSPFGQRFIVNVSAIEGQFAATKLGNHVHTNMAKAALNMLTHTAAAKLALDYIFMNSVDPGWISQQAPQPDKQNWERIQQLLPLDLTDAAARVCDPIFTSLAGGETPTGRFYKDYYPTAW